MTVIPPTSAPLQTAVSRQRLSNSPVAGSPDLQGAIKRYIADHNTKPRPFVWTKSAATILEKVARIPEPSV